MVCAVLCSGVLHESVGLSTALGTSISGLEISRAVAGQQFHLHVWYAHHQPEYDIVLARFHGLPPSDQQVLDVTGTGSCGI